MLSAIGLFGGLILLVVLTMIGMNLLVAAPLSALFMAVLSGMPLFPQLVSEGENNFVGDYMDGFSDFVASWFLMFLLGSIFGKVMEDSRSAESVSKWAMKRLGTNYTVISIVAACAILTYGGVSLFIVGFTVFPIALSLFKRANLPRRFIPACLAFGSVTFTMTSAGSPEIQNWIPMKHLGTGPYAGWEVSLIVAIFMMVIGYLWLRWMINRAIRNGEQFEERGDDPEEVERDMPNPLLSCIPLIVVLVVAFIFHDSLDTSALILALSSGILTTWLLNHRYLKNVWKSASDGTYGALMAIANTSAVVGFGSVAQATPAFEKAVDVMTNVPGDPLFGASIAVVVIVGLTGSASGGLEISLPIIGPDYLDQGVNAEALHRVSTLSAGALDSLPHGGYTVTTIRAICGETHKSAYPAVCAVTVVVPTLGVLLAIILFSLGI